MKLVPEQISVSIPEPTRLTLARVMALKGITPESAATQMVQFACRILEDGGLQKDSDLATDLDFSAAFRTRTLKRTDQLLGVAEKILLESQGLHRGLRNRSFSDAKEG